MLASNAEVRQLQRAPHRHLLIAQRIGTGAQRALDDQLNALGELLNAGGRFNAGFSTRPARVFNAIWALGAAARAREPRLNRS